MDKLGWFISSAVLAAVVIALRALFGKRMSPLVRCLVWLPLLARKSLRDASRALARGTLRHGEIRPRYGHYMSHVR